MNFKLLGSLLLVAIGIYLIVHGIGLLPPAGVEKDMWQKTSDFFADNPMWNPLIEFFGGTPIQEAPKHKTAAIVTIGIGACLSLIGFLLALFSYKRKS